MKTLFPLAWIFLGSLLSAQPLTLEYSSGDVRAGGSGHWVLVEEGASLQPDQTLELAPKTTAVVKADTFHLYLANPGASPKVFSLQRAVEQWKKASPGQTVLTSKLAKLVGAQETTPGTTANMGIRAEDQGQTGPEESTSDALWTQAQTALAQGDHPKAISVLNELLDYAAGTRLVDTAVLLAQQYWVVRDWASLDRWGAQALGLPGVPTDQKQLVLYLRALGVMARGEDPQPLWDQIRDLDPQSDLAQSLSPKAN